MSGGSTSRVGAEIRCACDRSGRGDHTERHGRREDEPVPAAQASTFFTRPGRGDLKCFFPLGYFPPVLPSCLVAGRRSPPSPFFAVATRGILSPPLKVDAPQPRVIGEILRRPREGDLAVPQDVYTLRNLQNLAHLLLYNERSRP